MTVKIALDQQLHLKLQKFHLKMFRGVIENYRTVKAIKNNTFCPLLSSDTVQLSATWPFLVSM